MKTTNIQAFAHNIFFNQDFIEHKNAQAKLPSLHILAKQIPSEFYNETLKYDHNQGRDVFLSTNKNFKNNSSEQKWMFKVDDVLSFFWEKGSSTIYYDIHNNGDERLLKYWLLHTFLPIYLTIENRYELIHAGGVEIDKQAVLFIAPSFGGKSTLSNYFIQKQHPMLSDDRVALKEDNGTIMTVSSYPYHRPYRQTEDLGIPVKNFIKEKMPLHCIYVLQAVDAKQEIDFTLLKGIDKFKALQYNFDFNLPLNKANSFQLIAKIAAIIPVYKISIPWDLDRLEEVYQAICEHSKHILDVSKKDVSNKSITKSPYEL